MIGLALLAVTLSAPADLRAVGMVLPADPAHAVAVLRSGGRSRVVKVGERAFGGRVGSIDRSGVVVEYEEGPVTVGLQQAGGPTAAEPVPPPPAEAEASGAVMERAEVQRRLSSEVTRILAETTLVPVTQTGGVRGFALTRVPEGTLLPDAGLRAGDVLLSINEVPIDSRATLLALWPKLQGESVIRAEVLRDGEPVSLSVVLK